MCAPRLREPTSAARSTRELLDIAGVLQCARLVRGYIADDSVGKTPIDHLFYALRTNKFLEEKITGSIVGEDEIADAASPSLRRYGGRCAPRRQERGSAAEDNFLPELC